MTDKQIIIDGVDVSGCEFYSYIESNIYPHRCTCYEDIYGASVVCDLTDCCKNCYYKQLKAKEQECEDLRKDIKDIANLLDLDTGEEYNFGNIESAIKNYCADCDVAERMRKVTYAATGGRLSYANYTVEAIEQAYNDQLRIDVEYRTKELEEQLKRKEQECERLKEENKEIRKYQYEQDFLQQQLDQLKSDNKHLNDLLNQALKELEESREAIEKIKKICGIWIVNGLSEEQYLSELRDWQAQILQICDEVNE